MLILILNTKIQIEIDKFEKSNLPIENKDSFKLILRVILFDKIKIFSKDIKRDLNKLKKRKEDFNELIKKNKPNFKIIDIVKLIVEKIELKTMRLNLELGIDDIIVTTYLVPIISTLISVILKYIQKNKSRTCDISYKVSPIYNKNAYIVQLNCIINIKLVHIMHIIYVVRKRRDEKWKNIQ